MLASSRTIQRHRFQNLPSGAEPSVVDRQRRIPSPPCSREDRAAIFLFGQLSARRVRGASRSLISTSLLVRIQPQTAGGPPLNRGSLPRPATIYAKCRGTCCAQRGRSIRPLAPFPCSDGNFGHLRPYALVPSLNPANRVHFQSPIDKRLERNHLRVDAPDKQHSDPWVKSGEVASRMSIPQRKQTSPLSEAPAHHSPDSQPCHHKAPSFSSQALYP